MPRVQRALGKLCEQNVVLELALSLQVASHLRLLRIVRQVGVGGLFRARFAAPLVVDGWPNRREPVAVQILAVVDPLLVRDAAADGQLLVCRP